MSEFKDRLKELRKEKGLTLEELSDKLQEIEQVTSKKPSTSRISLGFYERDEREPTIGTAIILAKFFDVTTDYLLGLSDERKQKTNTISTDDLLKEIFKRGGLIG